VGAMAPMDPGNPPHPAEVGASLRTRVPRTVATYGREWRAVRAGAGAR
jgi:hypothetical protein